MHVCRRMFQQTLDGAAQCWFGSLEPGSINSWEELREQFLTRFSLRQKGVKDPTEITKIMRRANETLPDFKERWTDEASYIPGVPELMRISSFMNAHKCPELAERFSEQIPRTVKEMMTRVDDFVRSKAAYKNTELPKGEAMEYGRKGIFSFRNEWPKGPYVDKRRGDRRGDYRSKETYTPYMPPKHNFPRGDTHRRDGGRYDNHRPGLMALIKQPRERLATEHQLRLPHPPPLMGKPSRENTDRYCDYHGEKSTSPTTATS